MEGLVLDLVLILWSDPAFLSKVACKLFSALDDPLSLCKIGRQPLPVMKGTREAEEGNNGGQLVEDEEGGDVRDWGVLEPQEGRPQEAGGACNETVKVASSCSLFIDRWSGLVRGF